RGPSPTRHRRSSVTQRYATHVDEITSKKFVVWILRGVLQADAVDHDATVPAVIATHKPGVRIALCASGEHDERREDEGDATGHGETPAFAPCCSRGGPGSRRKCRRVPIRQLPAAVPTQPRSQVG